MHIVDPYPALSIQLMHNVDFAEKNLERLLSIKFLFDKA